MQIVYSAEFWAYWGALLGFLGGIVGNGFWVSWEKVKKQHSDDEDDIKLYEITSKFIIVFSFVMFITLILNIKIV